MKKHSIKSVKLVEEDSSLYLDITYIIEDESTVEELHIPRVQIPLCKAIYPELKDKVPEEEEIYSRLCSNWYIPRHNVTLQTGCGNELKVAKDPDGNYYTVKTIKEKAQEMTLEEIEKKLGHKVKIVSEGKKR